MLLRCTPVCLALGGSLSPSLGQTIYYVANSGNDSNTGRSSDTPFQTISKINSLSLQPGDQVLFRRNDTFQGSLQLRQSGTSGKPIVVDAYGSGNKPVLCGAIPVSNWTNMGNNTWQASCPGCGDRLTGLYRDNAALPLGRYPNLNAANKGYLTVQSHSGKTQLTSQQALPANWSGAEAVFRPVQWILNRATITAQSGNTLTLAGSGNYDIADNWGYFIQNHPATLDQRGEWYYNPTKKTIQLYDDQTNPNGQLITATAFNEGISVSSASFVTIRNLKITQTLATGLSVTNSSNLTISNIDITQSGEDALRVQGSGQQLLLENNLIEDANNNGVDIGSYQNVTFRGNTLRRIGLIPGRGKSGDGTYVGFQSASTANTLIENNVIDNIGYNALNFSTSTTVQRNQISNFCLTKSDGSGLYIWNGNQQALNDIHLISNIVFNGIGAPEGSPDGTSAGAHGIYLDDCTNNMEVANNTVYNCRGLGIFLHGSSNVILTGNTAYNNNDGQLSITSAGGCQPRNNQIQNNIFVSRLANQFNVKYESNQNDLSNYGQFDNNAYGRPFEDTYKVLAVYNRTTGAALSLSQWQSQYNKDLTTTNSPITYSSGNPDDYIKCLANCSANSNQVSLEGTYRDMRNRVYTGQVTIPAYSSMVLLKDVTLSQPLREADNPANAVTGLDYSYYEGNWSTLPTFSTLTPVKSGIINTPTLAVRSRDDNFALRYTGYVKIPADGVYTFYTNSDDGSKLLIGSTEVVNNDGGHVVQERSGTIGLKAGLHALTIVYFEGGGDQALTVSYSGTNLSKQVIPDASFMRVAPVVSLRAADNPANTTAGLDYSYYEGSWSNLPDFNTLSPVKTGTSTNPSLTVRNRDSNYSMKYTGYISIPTDGTYTFYTTSDDGSKLLIGATEIVNNDGIHADQERSGTIGLKAGLHAISILFFQGAGGQTLIVSYSGPNLGKQVIPDAAFRRVAPVQPLVSNNTSNGTGTGLRAAYFNNQSLTAPSVLTRTDATVDFDWGTGSPAAGTVNIDNFSVRWTGQVEAPVSGAYTFSTNADDGVRLWVNGVQLINDWNAHPPVINNGSSINLTAGQRYDIRLEYFENSGGALAKLWWSYPGQAQQTVPQIRLYPASTAYAGGRLGISEEQVALGPLLKNVYPVPARQSLWIQYFAETAGEATIQLVNSAALPVHQTSHQVVPGENLINLTVDQLNRGSYILTLTQNQQRLSRKVILTE
ncbi:glycoside hydrolase [Spirosoma radiotolerans]|uniref:Glycoside hydrolase n=2 Tax=Spirosoma radiotolerans TaxID=1379870 RepID=A0A0E3V7V9_9BACT|nr:glycoside hydrolase [Spirosoma radiotolerans]